jgi:hypothetical protein
MPRPINSIDGLLLIVAPGIFFGPHSTSAVAGRAAGAFALSDK